MAAPSPLTANSDLVSFAIKAGGRDVDDRYDLLSITVEHALNRVPSAVVVVRDGSAAQESFAVSAGKDFAPGVKIEILAGYHGTNTSIFSGIIVKSSIQQVRGGHSTFTFTCRDAAVAMTIGRPSACHTATTDSSLMTKLITDHSLTADVTATSDQLEEITQFAASDWDFLLSRAEANGFVVVVAAGKVTVQAPALAGSPVLTVTYGFDIFDVDLEEDVRSQYSSVACAAWDPATQALLKSTETPKNANPLGSDTAATLAKITGTKALPLHTTTPLKTATLKTWAEAQLLKSALAKIRGSVRFQGSALALPGTLITLDGFGERFDGDAYVSGVTHEIRDGNWTTLATIGLDPAWFAARADVSAPRASALLPAVPGLQLGTVKQIETDPGNEHRVLVEIHTIDDTGKGIWARLASPYATKNAGVFFYPEVGDEVVLAFLDSNPRFPIILGSLQSSSRPPSYTADKKNTHKAIVTNSQLKLHFDDDKKIITIETPAGNKLEFNDDTKFIKLTDQSGNFAKLEASGITLSSVKNITLTAAQNVTIEAKAGTLIAKGAQGVTISGLKVALSADTELTATGTASATLTSPGNTTVKGAMVMIN